MDINKKKTRGNTGLFILCGVMLLIIVVLVMLLLAQRNSAKKAPIASLTEPTAVPEATAAPVVDRNFDAGTPVAFEPDLSLLGIPDALTEDNAEAFTAAHFVDITPADIRAAGATLIRHTELDFVFLYYDGAYYYLGESWDGHGLADAALCDLNFDDGYEILYTFSTGTGSEYTAKIGWFDLATRQNVIAPVSGTERNFAIVADGLYSMHLYTAKRSAGATDGGYVLTLLDPVGQIVEQSGALYLLLD